MKEKLEELQRLFEQANVSASKKDVDSMNKHLASAYDVTLQLRPTAIADDPEAFRMFDRIRTDFEYMRNLWSIQYYPWEKISERVDYPLSDLLKKLNTQVQHAKEQIPIPATCNTVDSKKAMPNEVYLYIGAAIMEGLVSRSSNGHYKWNGNKNVLSYFCSRVSEECKMGKGIKGKDDLNPRVSWSPFEELFGIKDLKKCFDKYQNRCGQQTDIETKIDEIIKKLNK